MQLITLMMDCTYGENNSITQIIGIYDKYEKAMEKLIEVREYISKNHDADNFTRYAWIDIYELNQSIELEDLV